MSLNTNLETQPPYIPMSERYFILTEPSEELYKDAANKKQHFKVAIEAYEESTQGSEYKTGIHTDSVHTWEGGLEKMDIASQNYNDIPSFLGKIRRSSRKTSDLFDAWASVLPSQSEYFSVICGGLKLRFGVGSNQLLPIDDVLTSICPGIL